MKQRLEEQTDALFELDHDFFHGAHHPALVEQQDLDAFTSDGDTDLWQYLTNDIGRQCRTVFIQEGVCKDRQGVLSNSLSRKTEPNGAKNAVGQNKETRRNSVSDTKQEEQ